MVCYNASITSPKHRCMLMHIAPICLSISSFILPWLMNKILRYFKFLAHNLMGTIYHFSSREPGPRAWRCWHSSWLLQTRLQGHSLMKPNSRDTILRSPNLTHLSPQLWLEIMSMHITNRIWDKGGLQHPLRMCLVRFRRGVCVISKCLINFFIHLYKCIML